MYKIRLENTVTHHIYEQMVEDINGGDKLYFLFSVDTVSLDNGEYVLSLYDEEDTLLCEEILRIGDFNSNALQYSKGDNTYIEFVVKTVIQNRKNVTIDSIQTTILPDSGNDAMGAVYVDAQPLYDSALNDGKELGIIEQKEKLTSIAINENGVYENADGYNEIVVNVPDLNGSYDEGYSEGYDSGRTDGYNEGVEEGLNNAGGIIAETAQELDITENGYYLTKYADDVYVSPDQITGDFGDGTYFYDWGELKDGCYDTKIIPTANSRIEFWWKAAETSKGSNYQTIFGCGYVNGNQNTFDLKYKYYSRVSLELRIGNKDNTFTFDNKIWNHFVIDNGTLWLNDVELFTLDLSTYVSDGSSILINSVQGRLDGNANGLFGMFKIDNHIFIPKDGGFVNYQTNEQLGGYAKPNDATYDYIESDQITGYFDDGTPFYGYAVLNKAYFNTNVIPDNDTNLELWWKDDGVSNTMYSTIIGTQQDGKGSDGIIKFCEYTIAQNRWEFDAKSGLFPRDNNWHHLVLNKTAFYYDGEKYADVNGDLKTTNVPIVINGLGFNPNVNQISNGYFGMVKIDGHIFIPTENGFINYDTKEPLVSNYIFDGRNTPFIGTYIFTENPPTIIKGEGNLIKSVTVNIPPIINVAKEGLKFGYSAIKEIPEWADFEGVTNMRQMFYYCQSLVNVRHIDTSSVTDMYWCFYDCGSLKQIATLDTSNVTNMERMFYYCSNLTTLPQLDVSKVTNMSNYFRNGGGNLTNVGGWKNLKIDWNDNYGLVLCPKLTYKSCINILNGLYDFVGNGESTTKTLKVNPNFLTTVGDEISIAANKGWQITA